MCVWIQRGKSYVMEHDVGGISVGDQGPVAAAPRSSSSAGGSNHSNGSISNSSSRLSEFCLVGVVVAALTPQTQGKVC